MIPGSPEEERHCTLQNKKAHTLPSRLKTQATHRVRPSSPPPVKTRECSVETPPYPTLIMRDHYPLSWMLDLPLGLLSLTWLELNIGYPVNIEV